MRFNNLPSGWEIKKMPQVVKWGSGGTPKATEKQYYEGGTIPWLIIGDLNDGIVTSSASKITKLGLQNSSAKMIPAGTLLVAMYGSIGKLGITGFECCTNQAIAYAKELHGVTTKYMFYYMAMMKSDLISKGKGGTQKNISQTVLNSLDVVVPPIPEQQRIVNRIEELFSQLDAGVETLKKTKAQLAVYRQAVLKEAFSSYHATKTVEISEIVDDIRIGPFGTMLHKSDYIIDGTPVINPQHIKGGKVIPTSSISVSDEKAKELSAYMLKTNDIIMGRRGEMGRTAAITDVENGWICGTGSILFRLKSAFDSTFYAKILSSPDVVHYLEEHATGTTMKNLNEDIVQHIPVPFVTAEMQKKITMNIDRKMSVCDSIEQTVNTTLQQAEAMRQSILKDAFEGRL
jgi:type I restriction enzyme S subunit